MIAKHYIYFFILFFLDQISKILAVRYLDFFESMTVIPKILFFQLVYNRGAAYGILQDQKVFLLTVGVLVIGMCIIFSKKIIQSKWSEVALIFLLGGAMGNVFDRFRLGHVVDFIDIRIFPLFNLADIMINIAIICFLIEMFFYDSKRKSE